MAPVAPKTLAPITTRATFPRYVEAFFHKKETDLKQLYVRQHEVARPLNAIKSDRITSAEQINLQQAHCAVKVVFESANKSVNANQFFAPRCDKLTQVNGYHGLSPEEKPRCASKAMASPVPSALSCASTFTPRSTVNRLIGPTQVAFQD